MLSRIHYFLLFAVAFAVTALLVPVVRRLAIHFDIVDKPGPRRVNKEPIPRMGGVAMFGGLLAAMFVEYLFELLGLWYGPFITSSGVSVRIIGIIVGFAVIVFVGVLDDVFSLTPYAKCVGQIVASCIIVGTGTLIMRFHMPFSDDIVVLGAAAYPITVLYLIAFINVINLIDGLDGLAAGVAAIDALTLFIIVLTLLRIDAALLCVIIIGICLGFLIYNFHPASIFMGDSGSMLLGLALGTVSLLGSARFASITIALVPIVIALVPIIDSIAAVIRRLRAHRPITSADAGHIHHRLLLRGYSQRKVVLLVYAWTALLSIGALLMWEMGGIVKYTVFVVLLCASAFVAWRVGLFGPTRKRHGRRKDVVYETHAERTARRQAEAQARASQTPAEALPGEPAAEPAEAQATGSGDGA